MNRGLALIGLPLTLAGCVVGPNYGPPSVPVASAWRSAPNSQATTDPRWWRSFDDRVLDTLEDEMLIANLSIEQALARVDQSRARVGGADAALRPSADASASVARSEQSLDAGLGQLSRYVPDFPRGVTNAQAGLGASWDLDFAGGLKRAREGAIADARAAEAGAAAARLAVAADLADAYILYRGGRAQRASLRILVGFLSEQRAIMATRVRLGVAPRAALDQSDATVAALMASLPPIETLIADQHNRIAILLGRSPSHPLPELDDGDAIPNAPDPAAGIPVGILHNRPDLVVAEQQLIASNAAIGQAMAQYYPSLSLSALLGVDANRLGSLVTGNALTAQGAFGLRWRLFDFGRIDADVRAARGGVREHLAAYREAVLRATAEVETGFVQLANARQRLADLRVRRGAIAAALTAEGAGERLGTRSRDALIDRQRELVFADLDITAARVEVARAIVACRRALGG
jgi:NodT family efflux transporter outer membrane factor (OMF) lipoprotein